MNADNSHQMDSADVIYKSQQAQIPTALVLDFDKLDCLS